MSPKSTLRAWAGGHRLALLLDLAVPRDVDPRVGSLERVVLYNVDDLRAQAEQNLQARRAQLERAVAGDLP